MRGTAYGASLALLLLIYQAASPAEAARSKISYPMAERSLLVSIKPNNPPESVPFDSSLQIGSPDISASDPRIVKQAPGCAVPEQVHLTYWSSTSVLVSWATCDAELAENVTTPRSVDSNSVVLYGTTSGKYGSAAAGVATSYVYDYSALGETSYASPLLHHVLLTGLKPGVTYFYSPGVGTTGGGVAASKEYNFTMPRPTFPLKIGVMADPGLTYNTSVMLEHLEATNPQLVFLVGDFCYADNWLSQGELLPKALSGRYTYQPKWDQWGRLFEPLLSHVPFIHTNGNHEIEQQPNGVRNGAYNHRYPLPQNGSMSAPVNFSGTSLSNPYTNLYNTVELPGVFKSISLTSYSPDQVKNGWNQDQEQFKWLEQQLQQTNRTATPWLIVLIHAPWYNSYSGHYKENECMREMYEWLLVKYNVDIALFGHVHAYERTKPVNNYTVDNCGPVHITIGDGGNIEGMYKDFIDTIKPQPAYCSNPQSGKQFPSYQPQKCITYQNGQYCYTSQPAWSAYREPSFGHGALELLNTTHAKWTWTKNQWPTFNVADEVTIVRKPGGC